MSQIPTISLHQYIRYQFKSSLQKYQNVQQALYNVQCSN